MTRVARHAELLFALTWLCACDGDGREAVAPDPPVITSAVVTENPHNAISAVVTVRATAADSVAAWVAPIGSRPGADSLTPAVRVTGDSASVPVLGLLPERSYAIRSIAYGPGGIATQESLTFTTGALPSDLPHFAAGGIDPSPGYVVFSSGQYGLVIDNAGRVVWYRRFSNGPGLYFGAQPNGRYVTRPTTNNPADPGRWVELDPLGNETRMLGCAGGLRPRLHDLMAEPGGGYWLLCDETRTMNLAAFGGVASATVTGTVVQHIAADGSLAFSWSAFDHFAITDVDEAERTGAIVNWTHGNAIDLGRDGNLLVSFRNLGEVTKIDVRTGDVIWRLGGRRNQFTFAGAPTPSFIGQHSARAYAPGALMLLDNIGDPGQSRAEVYAIDEATRTARLELSYGSTPAVSTLIGGSVQSLPRERTLVSFGTAGRVEEFDSDGRVMWSIQGHAGYVFRAQRIRSLYAPGVNSTR